MKKRRSQPSKFTLIFSIITLLCGIAYVNKLHSEQKSDTETPVLKSNKMEIPATIKGRNELRIIHEAYTVSYNCNWRIPNWVAYELLDSELQGPAKRKDEFVPDPEIPEKFSATTYDYSHSGFDRGHMIPSADVKWSQTANNETFYLSNICPQNQNLNRGIWNSLEEQVRNWAREKGQIYVVCGPIVADKHKTIGQNKVAVPEAFYKALLIQSSGQWYSIAFLFPNESGNNMLVTYALTVNELETKTGIDFFPELSDDIEEKIEDNVDWRIWNSKR